MIFAKTCSSAPLQAHVALFRELCHRTGLRGDLPRKATRKLIEPQESQICMHEGVYPKLGVQVLRRWSKHAVDHDLQQIIVHHTLTS